jgi:hypothetical protein
MAPKDLERIPVTVVTGFLGAGKTTLINHILSGRRCLCTLVDAGASGAPHIGACLAHPLRQPPVARLAAAGGPRRAARARAGKHGKKIAIIENEYGEVGVDDALVMDTKEEIFEMNNGCVCCTGAETAASAVGRQRSAAGCAPCASPVPGRLL